MDVLTRERAKPALAFGGSYQLIDFALSSLAHSGISDVWVSVQYLASSLDEHLAAGRPWDLDRTRGGFRRLVPEQGSRSEGAGALSAGNADDLLRVVDQIREFDPAEVVVLSSDHVFALDLRDVIRQHRERKATCTVVTSEVSRATARSKGVVSVDGQGRVTRFDYKPADPASGTVATEIFVYDGEALVDTLEAVRRDLTSRREPEELGDFGDHLLPALVDGGRVHAHPMEGYWRDLGQPELYLAAHRDLLAGRIDAVGKPGWPILSRFPERPPAVIRAGAAVADSIVNPGCVVRGTVTRSVLAPGVVIEAGAKVTDAVLGIDVVVAAGARVDTAIVDDHTRIGRSARVGAAPVATRPVSKDLVLVGTRCDIAAGSTVEPGARLEPGTTT